MAKQPLDLYRLFKLVVERGGLVEVCCHKHYMCRNNEQFQLKYGNRLTNECSPGKPLLQHV